MTVVVMVCAGLAGMGIGFYLAYLQWWVHIEMTRSQFFWAYWPLFLCATVAWGLALWFFECAVSPRKR